jgi:6,7-dimethyl-8-ribityllumazine synthase
MSSANKNLSNFRQDGLKKVNGKKVAIITAEWNEEVTFAMRDGAIEFLSGYGVAEEDLIVRQVPGSFELVFGANRILENENVDGVIVIGCVIQGETKHNDYINHAVAHGLTDVALKYNKPVIFGVLTPNTLQQALDRAGGIHGNKGDEAAITAIKMLGLQ